VTIGKDFLYGSLISIDL